MSETKKIILPDKLETAPGNIEHVDPVIRELLRSSGVSPEELVSDRNKLAAADISVGEAVGELMALLAPAAVRVIREGLESPNDKIRQDTARWIIEKAGGVKINRASGHVHFHFEAHEADQEQARLAIMDVKGDSQ